MKNFRSHFVFSRSQQNGIFLLILIIIALQLIYFFVDFQEYPEEEQSQQEELQLFQQKIDSLRAEAARGDNLRIFPFNPNFITDFKGYSLGMSLEEIDRLHAYRAEDKYVNSVKDFQAVTGVSDSLLATISPFFRFPDWSASRRENRDQASKAEDKISKSDLNAATAEDLMSVKGIGEVLAGRILNYRNKIGGFRADIQLKDIYGLNFETRAALEARFTVKFIPDSPVYDINSASLLEISSVPYFDYELAREIVDYRSLHEGIRNFEELAKIKNFPSEKIDRITLYLSLK